MALQLNPTALLAASLASALVALPVAAEDRDSALVRRGALLVGIGGCMDCHTPFKMGSKGPEKDVARGLSGHPEDLQMAPPPKLEASWNWAGSATMTAFVGPWGISYAANLTPDKATGIGAWSRQDFVQTMKTGKHVGVGRPIVPPMPWQALASLPEKDLHAIYAYLMAQPPVKNRVPEYAPAGAPPTQARAGGSSR